MPVHATRTAFVFYSAQTVPELKLRDPAAE
jgi:hypothetical protein